MRGAHSGKVPLIPWEDSRGASCVVRERYVSPCTVHRVFCAFIVSICCQLLGAMFIDLPKESYPQVRVTLFGRRNVSDRLNFSREELPVSMIVYGTYICVRNSVHQ